MFYQMNKSMIGMQIRSAFSEVRLAGPLASPCRSVLDIVASFATPVDIVSMHNLFLQDVVNGMAYVYAMCAIHT